MVDLEAEEGMEDINIEGVYPISKLLEYIPLHQGKVKALKDPNEGQFLLNTPLLPEKITFEGLCLAFIPHLKLEYWDFGDIEQFPHLAIDTFMKRVFYKEYGVTTLELLESLHGVNKVGLLNLLWVPHYHHTPINLTVIKQLLCLVHDGCFWLIEPIPIIDMLIHRITLLPHSGLNLAKSFGGKMGECDLAEKMKDKFKLVKKARRHSISSIIHPKVKVATQILAGKVMSKCHPNEVSAPVVLLAAQCVGGIQFN